jgi:ribA/ribD-fused uncharacterized protein
MGQWYETNFVFTENMLENFPTQLKELDLYQERFDVLEKLANDLVFNTAEKFMMMGKAALFGDDKTFDQMAKTNSPMVQKKLGRFVANFDEMTWDKYCKDIVKIGNYLKFSQNDDLFEKIIKTNDSILVEGSPMDRIWGVGLRFDDPLIKNRANWKGKNYLGECLMFVRQLIIGQNDPLV